MASFESIFICNSESALFSPVTANKVNEAVRDVKQVSSFVEMASAVTVKVVHRWHSYIVLLSKYDADNCWCMCPPLLLGAV